MNFRRYSSGEVIGLPKNALGAGGEAQVFVVGVTGLAAKIYHKPTSGHAAKLTAMLANPPIDPMACVGHVSIAWPCDLLVSINNHQSVLGYLMPLVSGMHPIMDYYHPKTRRQKHPLFNYLYLIRTARNLAAAVNALHSRGYVIGDVNESNTLVADTSLVTLVDTDSFQVPDLHNGSVYRCTVGKPEFTPPELHHCKFDSINRLPEHDYFGLAVIVFQLLMEGTHPFIGRFTARGEAPTIEDCISKGFFPYASKPSGFYQPKPLAPPFEILSPSLRDLFLQCFENGYTQPNLRPTAQMWQQALDKAECALIACGINSQHLYGNHLSSCPWCERLQLLGGVDPFPSHTTVQTGGHLSQNPPLQIPLSPIPPVLNTTTNLQSRTLNNVQNLVGQVKTGIPTARLAWRLNRRRILTTLTVLLIVFTLWSCVAVHKSLLAKTTLTFGISLDGKEVYDAKMASAMVDGKPFRSGNRVGLGTHHIVVQLPNAEAFERNIRVFYGKKDLGSLPIESSKGSLSVAVVPSPAKILLLHEGHLVQQQDAPFKVNQLPVGDYSLIIRRGEYEETRAIQIVRQKLTDAEIELNVGVADLSSDLPDTRYELSGNGRKWQGKLPATVPDIPVGTYLLAVNHKGWERTANITISRGGIASSTMGFPYGAIEVNSEPTGLEISIDGVEVGKTPIHISETRPGKYTLVATDGENDLTMIINVGNNETAKKMVNFRYTKVDLTSTPSGASVIRKGKAIGQTPLTLERVPAGQVGVELRLEGYASTNVLMEVTEDGAANLAIALVSLRYLQAMRQAHDSIRSERFADARAFIADAQKNKPNDPEAVNLVEAVALLEKQADAVRKDAERQAELARQTAERNREEAKQKAEEASLREQANARERELASLSWLDFTTLLDKCSDTRIVQNPVVMADGYYDQNGKFHATGQHTVMQNTTDSIFNDARFAKEYAGKTYKFDPTGWKMAKIEKDGTIVFRRGTGELLKFSQVEIRVTPSAASRNEFLSLKNGQRITIGARIGKHDQGDFFSRVLNRIYLEDGRILEK